MSKLSTLGKLWDKAKGALGFGAGAVAADVATEGVKKMGKGTLLAAGLPLIAGGLAATGIGKGLTDQMDNEQSKAAETQKFITDTYQAQKDLINAGVAGQLEFIKTWESGGFGTQLKRIVLDFVNTIFGNETITSQLENAHDKVDAADNELEVLNAELENDMLNQSNDMILKQGADKLGLGWAIPGPSNNLDDQASVNQSFNSSTVNNVVSPVGDIRQRLENNGFGAPKLDLAG
jgi:hypothetical protein